MNCLVVGAGGFIGAVLRYVIGLLPYESGSGFPVKTFCINVFGAFAIGIVAALAQKHSLDPRFVLFLKVGICGGFTTFSSFALETDALISRGAFVTAVLYAVFSVVLGVLAVFAAQRLWG